MTDLLLDTNIFIYAYDSASPFHSRCATLFESSELRLFTTSKNITECVAVMTKLDASKPHIEQLSLDISSNIIVLYPSAISLQIFEALFKIHTPRGNRVFDLEVASVMLANKISSIATVNTVDFAHIAGIQLFEF